MKILIMRHAEALSKSAAMARFDADRPLSKVGRDQARQVGQTLSSVGCLPRPIVCSPFVRTQETAALINEQLPTPVQMLPLTILAPGSGTDEILRAALNYARPTEQWVLAVMHEPDVSLILGAWLFPDSSWPFEVNEGDLYALRVRISHGKSSANLAFYHSPATLSLV